ncbi:zf-TFIIB domain-containing protein [Candidatus Saccharibacteria bacterium]|nr:zf-TFIIB domain-containing protein [Candidatus Saccharibacteria bacterium]MBI3337704.1 zf-TFIIB domain-containing protein [Candidatus Saccharibacteria bacterium]
MLCPICSGKLTEQQKGLFMCPDGHGTLVTGKYLSDIETESVPHEQQNKTLSHAKSVITCPHCSVAMQKVDYNSRGIIIDSCTNCHYRWLDSGEITKIKNFKSNIDIQDLLYVADVDMRIKQANQKETNEANPRLPLEGTYRAGAGVITEISGDSRVSLGAIVGQGLYGVVKGLTSSKTARMLTLTTLLIFGLLGCLILLDARNTFGF